MAPNTAAHSSFLQRSWFLNPPPQGLAAAALSPRLTWREGGPGRGSISRLKGSHKCTPTPSTPVAPSQPQARRPDLLGTTLTRSRSRVPGWSQGDGRDPPCHTRAGPEKERGHSLQAVLGPRAERVSSRSEPRGQEDLRKLSCTQAPAAPRAPHILAEGALPACQGPGLWAAVNGQRLQGGRRWEIPLLCRLLAASPWLLLDSVSTHETGLAAV